MTSCRRWLSAGLAALIVGVVVSPAGAVDMRHLPGDAEIIFTVNFQQIINSDLVKSQKGAEAKIREMVKSSPDGDRVLRYLKKAGFDVYRDLRSITFAAPGNGDPQAGVVVVEGNFEEDKFYSTAEEIANDVGNVQVKKVGGRRFLAVTPPDEKKQAYISLISPNVLVAASTEENLKAAWTRAGAGGGTALKQEVKDLLSGVESKHSIAFVATGSALTKLLKEAEIPNADKALPVVQMLTSITAFVTITKDIDYQLAVGMQDAGTAKQFAQQAAIGLAIAKEMVKQKASEDKRLEPAVDMMNSIRATAEQSNLVVRGLVTGHSLETLIKSFQDQLNQ